MMTWLQSLLCSRDLMLHFPIVQGTHQYMPSMHNPGMGHSGMQSMYNSAPQAIPGHMHPHSRSYPVDLGMSHHPMMDQVTHAFWSCACVLPLLWAQQEHASRMLCGVGDSD